MSFQFAGQVPCAPDLEAAIKGESLLKVFDKSGQMIIIVCIDRMDSLGYKRSFFDDGCD